MSVRDDASLWPPGWVALARFLEVGLEELPGSRIAELVDGMTLAQAELDQARSELANAALNAAVASGRVRVVCPDTPEKLLDPDILELRKEPT